MLFNKMLTAWLFSFDAVDKHDLKSFHLNSLLSLRQVKISWDFLSADVPSGILNSMFSILGNVSYAY